MVFLLNAACRNYLAEICLIFTMRKLIRQLNVGDEAIELYCTAL